MSNPKISKETDTEIEAYLRAGHSQNKTARKFGVSDGYVNKLSKRVNIHPSHSPPKKAIAARKTYSKAARIAVLHKLMERIDMAIDTPELKTGNLRDLSTALGTVLDKYRLEEKDTDDTSKGEIHDLLTDWKGADVRPS